jgi:hypothetical protein
LYSIQILPLVFLPLWLDPERGSFSWHACISKGSQIAPSLTRNEAKEKPKEH